jgi:hypothetical protein
MTIPAPEPAKDVENLMSGSSALRLFESSPEGMWREALPSRDVEGDLERARRVATAALEENLAAGHVLDGFDPDPEPGEPLQERLVRVLARLTGLENS